MNEKLLRKIDDYTKVLTNLYGICSFEILINIFIRDYPECTKIDKDELTNIVRMYVQKSKTTYVKDNFIVHNCINSDKVFDTILMMRKMYRPYIPSKQEIEMKIDFDFYDQDLSEYLELKTWVINNDKKNNIKKDIDKRMYKMYQLINTSKYPTKALNTIIEELIFLQAENELKEFLTLFQNCVNNSHLWINYSHAPASIKEDDTLQNDNEQNSSDIEDEYMQYINQILSQMKIPSLNQIKKLNQEFNQYIDKNEDYENGWFSTGDSQLKRIDSELRKILKYNEDIENLLPQLIPSWLSSIWHKDANRGTIWGNQKWDYVVFTVLQEVEEDLFLCRNSHYDCFLVYSHGIGQTISSLNETICCVLVNAGDFFFTYGGILYWKSLLPDDIQSFAACYYPQLYRTQGYSSVIQFNPVALWATVLVSNIPELQNDGESVEFCSIEGTFIDGIIPNFTSKWKIIDKGRYKCWTYNNDDFFKARYIFYDEKTKQVILFAKNEYTFELLCRQIKKYINIDYLSKQRVPFILLKLISHFTNITFQFDKYCKIFNV